MSTNDFETVPTGTMKELERLRAIESRLQEMIADYRLLHRSYAQSGDLIRSEMYAERIAQIETAMRVEA